MCYSCERYVHLLNSAVCCIVPHGKQNSGPLYFGTFCNCLSPDMQKVQNSLFPQGTQNSGPLYLWIVNLMTYAKDRELHRKVDLCI